MKLKFPKKIAIGDRYFKIIIKPDKVGGEFYYWNDDKKKIGSGAVEKLLCESDLSASITMDSLNGKKVSNREKEAEELLDLIYRIIHPKKKCSHPDWEKEAKQLYKKLLKFYNYEKLHRKKDGRV